jgi:hypothetical protein
MGDMRRARAVGQATRVSEAYVVFMLRTWESGVWKKATRRKGRPKGLHGRYVPHAHCGLGYKRQ